MKGFTLIELLAVILILSVIILISIAGYNAVIDNVKKEVMISNQKIIINSLKLYLTANENHLPNLVGDTTVVTLEQLYQSGFLKEIKDINSNTHAGYVLITKEQNNQYDYDVNVDYYNNGNSEDEILAHYKFDDFQEPTDNLFTSINLGPHMQGGLTYAYVGIEDGWHKYSISGTGTANTYPYTFNITPGKIHSDFNTTFSFLYKTNVREKYLTFGDPRMVNIIYKPSLKITDVEIDDYRKATLESVSPHTTTSGTPIVGERTESIYFLSRPREGTVFNPSTDFLYFKDVQVERKAYPTNYTSGIREGIIKDYSLNNTHINLNTLTTPRHISSGYKAGAYEFNGVNNIISLKDKNLNSTSSYKGGATVSLWLKPRTTENGFARYMAGFHYLSINASGKLQNMVNKPALEVNYWLMGNKIIPLNEWTHIVYIIKNNEYVRYYVNGKLDANYESSDLEINDYSSDSAIGATYDDYFDGYIDEFKVYNRALSKEEIEHLYLEYIK